MANSNSVEVAKALRSIDGRKILAELQNAARLPDHGTVAGQAVASLAMRHLGLGSQGPINDVDVFLSKAHSSRAKQMAKTERDKAAQHKRQSVMAAHVTSAGVRFEQGSYAKMFRATAKEGYTIVATDRDGMLNEVAYERTWARQGVSDAEAVMAGFDMNCVQVGVDIQSGQLVWTPEFEEFAVSQELRVINVNTPYHTASRYFKKKRELGCFGDDEFNMAMCALPWARGVFEGGTFNARFRGESTESCVAGRYGQKVHAGVESQALEITEWFREVKAMDHASIWTMEPVFKGHEEILKRLTRAAHPDTAEGIWRSSTAPLMFSNARGFCQSVLRPESKTSEARKDRLQALMAKAGASQDAIEIEMGLAKARGRVFMGESDLSETAVRAVSKVLTEHQALADDFSLLTLAEQGAAAIALRAAEKIRGDKVYGWLEGRQTEVGQLGMRRMWGEANTEEQANLSSVNDLLKNPANLEAFFEAESIRGETTLTKPLNLHAMSSLAVSVAKSLLKVRFKELVTSNDLEAEGRDMRHCVGGYSSTVAAGASRIFKVEGRSEVDRSTLEMRLGNASGHGDDMQNKRAFSVELKQLRSFANRDPGVAARSAADMLTQSLGKERSGQILAVASALGRALDAMAVEPSKMKSAKILLKAGLFEARTLGQGYSDLATRLENSLANHFPANDPSSGTQPEARARSHGLGLP